MQCILCAKMAELIEMPFRLWVFGVKLSDEVITDFKVLRDVALATIFGFLYTRCTLVPSSEYD